MLLEDLALVVAAAAAILEAMPATVATVADLAAAEAAAALRSILLATLAKAATGNQATLWSLLICNYETSRTHFRGTHCQRLAQA